VLRPDLNYTLLDAAAKKAAALSAMVARLELPNVEVVAARAEDEPKLRQRHAAVVARAVAPLAKLWAWSWPLLTTGGRLLALKGRTGPTEAASFRQATITPAIIGDGTIIRLDKRGGR
jgi:16S rRNA (guanine527-N7)-methyltransferase